jgi:hypothetical protein
MRRELVTLGTSPRVPHDYNVLRETHMVAQRSSRLIILCAALAVACGEPLSPRDVAGTYALQRVAGDALPALLYTNGAVNVRVFADTLQFLSDGHGTLITVRESEPVSGGPSSGPLRRENAFGFRITAARIEVGFECPPNADCVAPPHLILQRTGDGLEAVFALGARIPLTYTRVASAH